MLCEKVVCVYFAHARLFIDRESFSWNFLFEECGPEFKRSRKGFHILSNGAPRIAFTAQHYVTRNVATWCQLRRRKLDLTTWFCHQFVKSGIKKRRNIKLSFQRIYTCGSPRLFFTRLRQMCCCVGANAFATLFATGLIPVRLLFFCLSNSWLLVKRRKTSSSPILIAKHLKVIKRAAATRWRTIDITFFCEILGKARFQLHSKHFGFDIYARYLWTLRAFEKLSQ